jgi:Tfp pilus assembly protein PilV
MACPHNLATNRQTRMLANLSIVGCYNSSQVASQSHRQSLMLNSAVENLRQLAFFGVLEKQLETQRLFEWTFGVQFKENFARSNTTHAEEANITAEQLRRIVQLNQLDIALYEFAQQLFDARVKKTGLVRENSGEDVGDVKDSGVVSEYDSGVDDDSYNDDEISKHSADVAKNPFV